MQILRAVVTGLTVVVSSVFFMMSLDPSGGDGQAMPLDGLFKVIAVGCLVVGAALLLALYML